MNLCILAFQECMDKWKITPEEMGKLVEDYDFVDYIEKRYFNIETLTSSVIVEEFEMLLDEKGAKYRSREIVDSIRLIQQRSLLMLLNWLVANVTNGDIAKGYKILSETEIMKEISDVNSSYSFFFDSKLVKLLKEELIEKGIITEK